MSRLELVTAHSPRKSTTAVPRLHVLGRLFGVNRSKPAHGVFTIALLSAVILPSQEAYAQLPAETPAQSMERKYYEKFIADGEKAKRPRALPTPGFSTQGDFPNPHVQIAAADQTQFSKAISALASQASVAILAEGEPLHSSLTSKQAADVAKALTLPDVRFNDVLDVISKAFGYFAVRIDSGTILLYKRFDDPNDLPFVTYEEALYDLQGVLRVTGPLDPNVPAPNSPDSPIMHLLIDLTKEHGAHELSLGLPVSALSPDQARLVQQFSVTNYLSVITAPVRYVLLGMRGFTDPDAAILRINLMQTGLYVTGFEEPRYDGRKWQFLIGHGFRFQYLGMSARGIPPRLAFGDFSKPLPEPYQSQLVRELADGISDPTAPTEDDYLPRTALEQTITLKALAAKLDAIAVKPGLTISVNPALDPKTVTLFNESALPPERLLQDVALLYGLRVQHLDGGVSYLTMPSPRPATTLDEVAPAVEHLLPAPWQRALLGGVKAAEPLVLEGLAKDAQSKGQPFLEIYRSVAHNKAPKAAQDAIYSAAVHRLRVLVEPEIKISTTGRIAMPRMSEEEKRLFTLIWATQFLDAMDGFICQYPLKTIVDPSKLAVSGMIDSPTGGSMLYFGLFEGGHFHFEGGASMSTLKDFEAGK